MTRPGGFWNDKTTLQPYPPQPARGAAEIFAWALAILGIAAVLWQG